MFIYLDLSKAVGADTLNEKHAVRRHKESFAKKPVGVAPGNDSKPDKAEVGKRWNDAGESVDDALESDREKDTAIAQDRGVVGKPVKKSFMDEYTDMRKALSSEDNADDLLKSLQSELTESHTQRTYVSPDEHAFLLSKGFSQEEIDSRSVWISGRLRVEFSRWMGTRLAKSVSDLQGHLSD